MNANLMLQCCFMNGYCPYGNTQSEIFLVWVTTILILIMIGEAVHKYMC